MRVSLYGAGQVSTHVATVLSRRSGVEVAGPFGRTERASALESGADVVVIATTSFLHEIEQDIRTAVSAGSNVITTAEEAAYPWAVDKNLADELDRLAQQRGVTILGCGINPGYAFDAMVLVATGATWEASSIRVERVVNLGGFSETVLKRIGIGWTIAQFEEGKVAGRITGHIGFPQSMALVGSKLGVRLDRIDRSISPVIADRNYSARFLQVKRGETAGFSQRYLGISSGKVWFECIFFGHVDPESIGRNPRDDIWISGSTPIHLSFDPGLNPQTTVAAVVANSLRRVMEARPGWVTVGDLPPAIAKLV